MYEMRIFIHSTNTVFQRLLAVENYSTHWKYDIEQKKQSSCPHRTYSLMRGLLAFIPSDPVLQVKGDCFESCDVD